jgi:cytochrome c peroxidase
MYYSERSFISVFLFIISMLGMICLSSFNSPNSFNPTPFKFDLPDNVPSAYVPPDNVMTLEGVALGKKLFYDPLLSADHTIACASCHLQQNGFADHEKLSKGIGTQHAARNSMPLVNMAWINKYFWDGRAKSLEEVIAFPLTNKNEMGKDLEILTKELYQSADYRKMFYAAFGEDEITEKHIAKAIAQYVRTLTSFRSPADTIYPTAAKLMAEKKIEQPAAMKLLFGFSDKTIETLRLCEKCHNTITYGNIQMKNNGLDTDNQNDKGLGGITKKEEEVGLFKAPSFRNLILTAPYMHDGRFVTLNEVLEHYSTGIKPNPNLDPLLKQSDGSPLRLNLGEREKREVIYFLTVLMTDSSVLKI